jgi:hypothetical protein
MILCVGIGCQTYPPECAEGEFYKVHYHAPEWCWPIGPRFRLFLRSEALKSTLYVDVLHKDAL